MNENLTNVGSNKVTPLGRKGKIKMCIGAMIPSEKGVKIPPEYAREVLSFDENEEYIEIQAYDNEKEIEAR